MIALITEAILERLLTATASGDSDKPTAQEPGVALAFTQQELRHRTPVTIRNNSGRS